MTNSSVSTSVIIPTFNGANRILNVLDALNHQTYLGFEVVVAIDGSTDGTEDLVSGFECNFKELRIVRQPNKGRASIRNFGVKYGIGNLLIFFDDDMRPVQNCVELHTNHHLDHSGSILTGSQIEELSKITSDIQRFKAVISRTWESNLPSEPEYLNEQQLHLTAANMSIPKDLFYRLGGFDERLTDCEDLDLVIRASIEKVKIYFNPQAIGWHDDFITCKSYIVRRRQYEIALSKLTDLHPSYAFYLKRRLYALPMIKRFVYNIFSRSFWINRIDKENLAFLPRIIRYKIYELTIWGLSKYFPSRVI